MRIGADPGSFHVLRAYARSSRTGDVASRSTGSGVERRDRVEVTRGTKSERVAALVGAGVDGPIDLEESQVTPASSPGAFPMYGRPADRNAAATNILAGRVLDVTA